MSDPQKSSRLGFWRAVNQTFLAIPQNNSGTFVYITWRRLPASPPGGSGGGGGGLTPSSTAALGYAGGGHGETNYVWPRSASDPKIAPLYGNGWANTGAGGGGRRT